MTIRKQHLAGMWMTMAVLVALALAPRLATAQCGMMGGGGGHDHSATQARDSRKVSGAQKKQQQSIDRLLSDEQGRTLLASALLNDRVFVQDFIQRLAAIPEWRALAAQQFGPGPAGGAQGAPRPTPQGALAYVCPMHPDVTSATPADCPKCGMKLERRQPEGG